MPTRRARLLLRALLVLFGLGMGACAFEVFLRVLGEKEERVRRETVFDPWYGTVRADSWVFDFEVPPQASEVELRGQRVPLEVPEGETRFLFIGDSGTEGVLMPLEDTFPAQFERILHEERPELGVRALNAGVFGMTTIDELHFLERRLLPLAPDVVVVGLFMANDINFNLAHTERLESVRPEAPRAETLVANSAVAYFLYHRLLSLNAKHRWFRAESLGETRSIARKVALVDSYGFHMLSYKEGEVALAMREPSALVDRAFVTLERVLFKMRELGRTQGFALRVLLIPTPSAVNGRLTLLHYPDIYAELSASGIEVTEASLDVNAPTRRVLAICDKLEIDCVDPTPALHRVGMEAFFPTDEHPTERGHAILARALADHTP